MSIKKRNDDEICIISPKGIECGDSIAILNNNSPDKYVWLSNNGVTFKKNSNRSLYSTVFFFIVIMFFAFIGALGADLISLILCAVSIAAVFLSIMFLVFIYSLKVWIGVISTIGIVILHSLLFIYVFVPAWISLGNSLVIAFQNFIGLF